VSQLWDGKLFSARWSNIIAGWCVRHYKKFKEAPGKKIQSLFDRWADANQKDQDTIGLVSAFLSDLSASYSAKKKDVNPEYVLDLAKEYFDRVRLEALKEDIGGLLADGDVAEAWKRVNGLRPVEVGLGSAVNPLADQSAVRRALEERSDPLITYPGALGAFFGDALEREGFISATGPEKRGKSTLLFDMAWQAALQGRKVAIFQLGDLSQGQFLRRMYSRVCGRPYRATDRPVRIPNYLGPPTAQGALPDVRHDEKEWKKPLSPEFAAKRAKKLLKRLGPEPVRLSTHPARSLSVAGMTGILDNWERDGWKADVVVIDYADLFAPMNGKAETRDQINETWIGLSGVRLAKHCLIVTATQSDAGSSDADIITMKNFSEDKRKWSHVTGGIGINQTDDEKAAGVYRLNWVVGREWEYSTTTVVYTAGCMALQSPFMFSTF
jgi:hypothetical protein